MYHLTQRQIQKSARNSLRRKLKKPDRKAKEDTFELAHQSDTDEQLYAYVKERRRKLGKRMTKTETIGYRYLVQRLGPWDKFMGQIGLELQAERENKAERKASLPDTVSRPAAIGNQRLTGGNRGESSGMKRRESAPPHPAPRYAEFV